MNADYYFNRALANFNLELTEEGCKDLQEAIKLEDEQAKEYSEEFCGN